MVIGDRFAWGHIPRTGGDAVHALFKAVAHPSITIDDQGEHFKHDTFLQRGCHVGRDLALNIRRLPSIFLSCKKVFTFHGVYPDYEPLGEPSKEDFLDPTSSYGRTMFDRLGLPGPLATIPDRYLAAFTDEGRLTIKHWLRMENLREDFIEFIGQYHYVPVDLADRIRTIPTKEPLLYNHNVSDFFTQEDIATLYRNNPLWREVEIQVYGHTL